MIIDQLSIVPCCQARSREYITLNHVVSLSVMIVENVRKTKTSQKATEMWFG